MRKGILKIVAVFAVMSMTFVTSSVVFGEQNEQQNPTDGIRWMTLEQATEAQKKEPRKVLLDLYTDWCGWCKKMEASTFSDPFIVNYINKHFYAVKLNGEGKDPIIFKGKEYVNASINNRNTQQLAWELGSVNNRLGYPTVVILDEDMNKLSTYPGYKDVEAMESLAKYFGENIYKTKTWQDYISGGK
jgi:thioredoxin-related protein